MWFFELLFKENDTLSQHISDYLEAFAKEHQIGSMENQDSIHLRQYLSGLVYKYYTKKRPCRKNTLKFRQSAQSQLEPAHPNDGELEAISSPVQTGPADDQESIGSSNSSSSSSSASEEKTHQNRWTRSECLLAELAAFKDP